VVARAAGRALKEMLRAADWDDGDEEERDEAHALLVYELPDRAAVAAAHLPARSVRAPSDEAHPDDQHADSPS